MTKIENPKFFTYRTMLADLISLDSFVKRDSSRTRELSQSINMLTDW